MAGSWLLRSSPAGAASPPGAVVRPACFLLLVLILLLPLLPPETRGESMAGAAALIAVLCLAVPPPAGDAARALLLALALSAAATVFLYPGRAVEPVAVALLAAAAGVHAARLPRAFRWGAAVPVALSVAGAAVSLHAVTQKLWGLGRLAEQVRAEPWIPDREAILARLGEGRAFGAFPTPAALGGFLSIALPVTVALALGVRRRARVALLAAAALEIAGLLSAASATAAAALLAALALLAVSRRSRGRSLLAGILALVLMVAAIAAIRGREVVDPAHPQSPWTLRSGNFRAAWAIAAAHPWAGVGPGGFGVALAGQLREGENETRYAHDLPLQLAAETGIPAAAVLSVLFLALFLWPVLSRPASAGPAWLTGASVGLAAFALQNLADFTAFLPSMLWLAALLRAAISPAGEEDESRSAPTAPASRWPVLGGVLAAAAVAVVAGLAWNARVDARQRLAAGDLDGSVASARRAVALAPWDAEGPVSLAHALLARGSAPGGPVGDLGDALASAERAVALDPSRPGGRDVRARARTVMGDLPGAFADLAEASRLYPSRAEYARRRDEIGEILARPAGSRGGP